MTWIIAFEMSLRAWVSDQAPRTMDHRYRQRRSANLRLGIVPDGRLPAGYTHVTAYTRTVVTVDNKIVAFRLEADGAIDRFVQQIVGG